jgi:hypothetical protein
MAHSGSSTQILSAPSRVCIPGCRSCVFTEDINRTAYNTGVIFLFPSMHTIIKFYTWRRSEFWIVYRCLCEEELYKMTKKASCTEHNEQINIRQFSMQTPKTNGSEICGVVSEIKHAKEWKDTTPHCVFVLCALCKGHKNCTAELGASWI